MPIFKTPQDTRAARGMKPTVFVETCQEIQQRYKRLTSNNFDQITGDGLSWERSLPKEPGLYVYGVINGLTEAEKDLPQGFHPIVVPMPKIGDQVAYNVLVGDVRPFTKIVNAKLQVVALKNYMLVRARTILSTSWANGNHVNIGHISPVLSQIFASWITETINSTYRLNPADFVKLRILSAHYYRCLHSEVKEIEPSNKRALAAVMARHLNVDVPEVEDVIEKVGVIQGLEDFVSKIKSYLDAPQLQNFDTAAFVTKIGGSWFGFGGADMAVCALEHPPTFISMVYLAFTDRGYKAAGISNVVERFRRQGEAEIVRGVERIIKEVETGDTFGLSD